LFDFVVYVAGVLVDCLSVKKRIELHQFYDINFIKKLIDLQPI